MVKIQIIDEEGLQAPFCLDADPWDTIPTEVGIGCPELRKIVDILGIPGRVSR